MSNKIRRREQIKNEAQREIYRNEILFTKIKEKTWDQMETHLKALVGLTSTGIVFNFHVRKRTEQELRKYIHTPKSIKLTLT